MEKEGMNYLTTIPVEPGDLWHFVHVSLETCSLYLEKLFIQKFKDISSQVLNNFFQPLTSWRLSEAVSVSLGMNSRLRDTRLMQSRQWTVSTSTM